MAYEHRRSHTYFYSAQRVGGKVVKKYVGKGPAAQAVAAKEAAAKDQKRRDTVALSGYQSETAEARRLLVTLEKNSEALLAGALSSAGYIQERGREWRFNHAGRAST